MQDIVNDAKNNIKKTQNAPRNFAFLDHSEAGRTCKKFGLLEIHLGHQTSSVGIVNN